MSPIRRLILCVIILTIGFGAKAGLEEVAKTDPHPLNRRLATLPYRLGSWQGRDEDVDPEILEKAQADDYLSRVYEDRDHPGRKLVLWVNYSEHGLNLRHSPEVCLPSGGWAKVESQSRVITVPREGAEPLPITRLGYSKGEMVQGIGFWYYIFGEGELEHFVRTLPITSRSSHGRTTRGSGLTVEVFCPVESDPDGEALQDFARVLLKELDPIMPKDRANYYVP